MSLSVVGFEHLHLHSDFSLLDGYGQVEEYSDRATQINQKFICVTDHGMMGAIPRQIRACEEKDGKPRANKLFPIFGCELYVNPEQPEVPNGKTTGDMIKDYDEDTKKRLRKSYHLLAIAYNNIGYTNLVKLSSWGWLKGYYYRPRVNHQILMAHREGIVFTSCCYMGEIGQAFEKGMQEGGAIRAEELGEAMLVKYMAMFGEDFRLEIMLLDFTKQKPYDKFIVKMHAKYGLPIIVTNDCHYCNPEDSEMQRNMLLVQTKKTRAEADAEYKAAIETGNLDEIPFEYQDQNLWMKSEEELNEKWLKDYSDIVDLDVFQKAKMTTVEVCNKAKGVTLDRSLKLPKIENANDKLRELVLSGFAKRGLPRTREYLDRIKEEYILICEKEFASYFLIEKMMTDEARRYWAEKTGNGHAAVGPGRGSAAGSLICYCLGITDVNPVYHDLLFSRFLSPVRGGKSMKLRFSINPIASI